MTREPLNDAEQLIVREGLAAANLLASDDLLALIHSLTVEAFTCFTDTRPDQKDAREHFYNLSQGLKAIEGELNARVQKKDEIERRLNANDANDDLIDDADLGVPE
jgi:hypothetical protein